MMKEQYINYGDSSVFYNFNSTSNPNDTIKLKYYF